MSYNERDGKSGFGVVIQDIDATGAVCFGKINDLKNYHKMVPHVKGVDIYEERTLSNVSVPGNVNFCTYLTIRLFHPLFQGTALTSAKFKVGIMGMKIGYYLKLRHEPKYNTLSWTLDYRYNSDVGKSYVPSFRFLMRKRTVHDLSQLAKPLRMSPYSFLHLLYARTAHLMHFTRNAQ